jgi:hypothetical protein
MNNYLAATASVVEHLVQWKWAGGSLPEHALSIKERLAELMEYEAHLLSMEQRNGGDLLTVNRRSQVCPEGHAIEIGQAESETAELKNSDLTDSTARPFTCNTK